MARLYEESSCIPLTLVKNSTTVWKNVEAVSEKLSTCLPSHPEPPVLVPRTDEKTNKKGS